MIDDDISWFTAQASKYKVLTKPEELELVIAAQGTKGPPEVLPSKKARDKLIKHNIKLVISIAKRYVNQGLPFEDLIQEGLFGLDKAITKFDTNRRIAETNP